MKPKLCIQGIQFLAKNGQSSPKQSVKKYSSAKNILRQKVFVGGKFRRQTIFVGKKFWSLGDFFVTFYRRNVYRWGSWIERPLYLLSSLYVRLMYSNLCSEKNMSKSVQIYRMKRLFLFHQLYFSLLGKLMVKLCQKFIWLVRAREKGHHIWYMGDMYICWWNNGHRLSGKISIYIS